MSLQDEVSPEVEDLLSKIENLNINNEGIKDDDHEDKEIMKKRIRRKNTKKMMVRNLDSSNIILPRKL